MRSFKWSSAQSSGKQRTNKVPPKSHKIMGSTQDQVQLGLGRIPATPGNTTRVVSPPSGLGTLSIALEPSRLLQLYPRKRKASALTPDNADAVLSSCFDVSGFVKRLRTDPDLALDERTLFEVMKDCVKDSEVVGFSSVVQRHLDVLGLNVTLDLDLDAVGVKNANKSDSSSNKILHKALLDSFQKHFNVSQESGCRCIIYQYLVAAVVYAQGIIDNDVQLKADLSSRYNIKNPHIAVFTELPIPHTRITYGDISYVFHGLLDYGIGYIKGRDVGSLGRGSLKLDPSRMLSGILEAKSLTEMQNAEPQIIIQVLTILALTGRPSFTGALTNGALWRFFVAHAGADRWQIYSSAELATDTDQGLIIELLKDMILYPSSPLFSDIPGALGTTRQEEQ